MDNNKVAQSSDPNQLSSASPDQVLSARCWRGRSMAFGCLDTFAFGELVSDVYAVRVVAVTGLVGNPDGDRYVALELDSAELIATLWTNSGGRRGHRVRFDLAKYNSESDLDDLTAELRLLLERWCITPRPRRARPVSVDPPAAA